MRLHGFTVSFMAMLTTTLATVLRRAGAPLPVPISPNCTTINPLPHAAQPCGSSTTINGWMLDPTVFNASILWASYVADADPRPVDAQMCFRQCNGYGYPRTCKSALIAYNVPTPRGYYGTAGGVLSGTCMLFNAYLNPLQFVPAPAGQYTSENAMNLYCPAGTYGANDTVT